MAVGSTNGMAGGRGYPYAVKAFTATVTADAILLKWQDPDDPEWFGTRIVRKVGSYPLTPHDGTLVVDNRERNAFAATPVRDTAALINTDYYYQAFPYAQYGVGTCAENRLAGCPCVRSGLSYSGNHTVSIITHLAQRYRLFTVTGSGTLTVAGDVEGDLCLVGGGRAGYGGERYGTGGYGGGGGYLKQTLGMRLSTTSIVIGTGGTVAAPNGGNTTAMGMTANGATSQHGGSGGGGGGSGDGITKYPLGMTALYLHCAGGGMGGTYQLNDPTYHGGAGGSNGSSGALSTTGYKATSASGGYGGDRGGGHGGGTDSSEMNISGNAASFYGGGGGGGGGGAFNGAASLGGAGYQGVVYIRVKA